jgi:cytidylate kinase
MQKYLVPLSEKNRARISAQAEQWRRRNFAGTELKTEHHKFITISRQFGCGVHPLAETLADNLTSFNPKIPPWAVYDKLLIEKIAQDHNLSEDLIISFSRKLRSDFEDSLLGLLKSHTPELKVYRSMVSTIRALAMRGEAIIVGRGSGIITRDIPGGIHIRIIASKNYRAASAQEKFNITRDEAVDLINKMDEEREAFVKKYLNADINDPLNYNVVYNSEKLTTEEITASVASFFRE